MSTKAVLHRNRDITTGKHLQETTGFCILHSYRSSRSHVLCVGRRRFKYNERQTDFPTIRRLHSWPIHRLLIRAVTSVVHRNNRPAHRSLRSTSWKRVCHFLVSEILQVSCYEERPHPYSTRSLGVFPLD